MRNVILVGEKKLERVPAWRQRHLGLRLSAAEMEMLRIVGDWLVERRQVRIDKKMVVPRVELHDSGGRDAHALQAEVQDRRCLKGVAVFDIHKINGRVRRRWGWSAGTNLILVSGPSLMIVVRLSGSCTSSRDRKSSRKRQEGSCQSKCISTHRLSPKETPF
jgi:hypothetical protein